MRCLQKISLVGAHAGADIEAMSLAAAAVPTILLNRCSHIAVSGICALTSVPHVLLLPCRMQVWH
jgi:hypothetical protein